MIDKVIEIELLPADRVMTRHVHQWDIGQIIKITDIEIADGTPVDFGNRFTNEGLRAYMIDNQVTIPAPALQQDRDLTGYVVVTDENSETTVKEIFIPVTPRPKPEDYVDEEIRESTEFQYVIQKAKEAEKAATAAEASATAAAASATAAETSAENANTFMENARISSGAAMDSADRALSDAERAYASLVNAETAQLSAEDAAAAAATSEQNAETSATLSKSYAEGGTGTRTGEDTNNAKYYMEQAALMTGDNYISRVANPVANCVPVITPDGQLKNSTVGITRLQDAFVVNISSHWSDDTYTELLYSADKTQAEIDAAYQADKIVMAQFGSANYFLGRRQGQKAHQFFFVNGAMIENFTCWDGEWNFTRKELLPDVTAADNGKILAVNEDGKWAKADAPKAVVVNITDNGDGTGSADKTFTEIVEAFINGRAVYAYGANGYLPIITADSDSITFGINQTIPAYDDEPACIIAAMVSIDGENNVTIESVAENLLNTDTVNSLIDEKINSLNATGVDY